VDATPPSLYRGHRYRGHRFPVEIISHCVWLYHWFPLSLRDVEQMMAYHGVTVSYETIDQWCRKFGQTYANALRRRRARPGDKWHLDEVFIKIAGKTTTCGAHRQTDTTSAPPSAGSAAPPGCSSRSLDADERPNNDSRFNSRRKSR